jgi:hypothetical protein
MKNLPTTPQFCVIAPTNYLQYATGSDTHLVLAHLVATDITYRDFYKNLSVAGDFIIMDNGAFELGQSYAPDKLIKLAHLCGADAIVLPDYPGKPIDQTIEAAKQLIPLVQESGFKTFFCPQAEVGDTEGWISSYVWAANNPDIDMIGMSILAIPNALPHIPKSYARVVMTQMLMDRGIFAHNKYHHYLGLNSAPNIELPSLLTMNALNSCDSSGPVWSAICGHRYNITGDSFMPVHKKFLREVDFDYPWTIKDHIHEAIDFNLQITFDIMCDPESYL